MYAYMPSEQSRKRSPGRMSKSKVSTSTELYTPTARVTAFLYCL
jgi:hypothetical protein